MPSRAIHKFEQPIPAIPDDQNAAVLHFRKMVVEAKHSAEIPGQQELITELARVSTEMLKEFPKNCTCKEFQSDGKPHLCQCCQRVLKIGDIVNRLEANTNKVMHEEVEIVKTAMAKVIEMNHRSTVFSQIDDNVMSGVVAKMNPSTE